MVFMKNRKNTESKNQKVVRTQNGRIMALSKFSVCNSKKSKFLKEQLAIGIQVNRFHGSNLTGIKVPSLSDLPILNECNSKQAFII